MSSVVTDTNQEVKEDKILVDVTDQIVSSVSEKKANVCETTVEILPITTKLRPEAPPFLPERIMTLMKGQSGGLKHQMQSDECFFTNVNLKEPKDVIIEEIDIKIENLPESIRETKSFRDAGLKPFSLVSNVKRSSPRSHTSETQDAVVEVSENQGTTDAKGQPSSPQVASRIRFPTAQFFRQHRTKIVVFVASGIFCVILAVYALL